MANINNISTSEKPRLIINRVLFWISRFLMFAFLIGIAENTFGISGAWYFLIMMGLYGLEKISRR
jgi:hypothetical protein